MELPAAGNAGSADSLYPVWLQGSALLAGRRTFLGRYVIEGQSFSTHDFYEEKGIQDSVSCFVPVL